MLLLLLLFTARIRVYVCGDIWTDVTLAHIHTHTHEQPRHLPTHAQCARFVSLDYATTTKTRVFGVHFQCTVGVCMLARHHIR